MYRTLLYVRRRGVWESADADCEGLLLNHCLGGFRACCQRGGKRQLRRNEAALKKAPIPTCMNLLPQSDQAFHSFLRFPRLQNALVCCGHRCLDALAAFAPHVISASCKRIAGFRVTPFLPHRSHSSQRSYRVQSA
jgi:hypothetical protein